MRGIQICASFHFNFEIFYYKFCRNIDLKLDEENNLREEATAAAQIYEDINQEYSEYGNRARSAEMKVQQTEGELRYRTYVHACIHVLIS